jgi:hypothetical protein
MLFRPEGLIPSATRRAELRVQHHDAAVTGAGGERMAAQEPTV